MSKVLVRLIGIGLAVLLVYLQCRASHIDSGYRGNGIRIHVIDSVEYISYTNSNGVGLTNK